MSLNNAMNIARNSLDDTQKRMSIVSRNLSGASDVNYSNRTMTTHLRNDGSCYTTIRRDADDGLLADYLTKRSRASGASIFYNGASQLNDIFGASEFAHSPTEALAKFKQSMQTYISQSDKKSTSQAVISNAQNLANSLNFAAKEIQKLRKDTDAEVTEEVKDVNKLLQQLKEIEGHIVHNDSEDVYSYMDQRDAVLKELSGHVSITFTKHDDGSVAVYAANGITLFDKEPREVTFNATQLKPGEPGGVIKIDGVPLTHSSFVSPNGDGTLGNLLKFRDETCVQYQNQLDLIAANLVGLFNGKKDKNVKGLDLFQVDSVTGPGMAGTIHVNPKYITGAKGGDSTLLGDSKNLQKIIDDMSKTDQFDYGNYTSEKLGLHGGHSLLSFAKESLSWVGSLVKNSKEDNEYKVTMFNHAEQVLSNQTGVNKDDELAMMVEIEQSYGASAKLISAVGKMMDDLLAAIR